MNGPMTTQTLRGMGASGPMHWRGGRTGSTTGRDALDEQIAFRAFNPAFVSLLGRGTQLTDGEMQAFTDFILTVTLPPNPIRSLDDVATTAQSTGQNLFLTRNTDRGAITARSATGCRSAPTASRPSRARRRSSRSLTSATSTRRSACPASPAAPPSAIRCGASGSCNDGTVSTVFNFVSAAVFQNLNTTDRQNIEQFLLAFDTGLKPSVGQQVSIDSTTRPRWPPRARRRPPPARHT